MDIMINRAIMRFISTEFPNALFCSFTHAYIQIHRGTLVILTDLLRSPSKLAPPKITNLIYLFYFLAVKIITALKISSYGYYVLQICEYWGISDIRYPYFEWKQRKRTSFYSLVNRYFPSINPFWKKLTGNWYIFWGQCTIIAVLEKFIKV